VAGLTAVADVEAGADDGAAEEGADDPLQPDMTAEAPRTTMNVRTRRKRDMKRS
jgi:hypothetical protein